jgi:AcrR family transcriptional regulator
MSSTTFRGSPKSSALPVKQQRSQETLDRLLAAAEVVLGRDGLQGTTVAAVAEEAGMSVGIVYKRFPDKDALLRAVYERFFEKSTLANAAALDPKRWSDHSAPQIVDSLAASMVRGYVQHPVLLRSLIQFAETHDDARFRERAEAMRKEAFSGIEALLLERADEISHPDAKHAIEFALLVAGLALRGILLEDCRATYKYAQSERLLTRELALVIKGYLGC